MRCYFTAESQTYINQAKSIRLKKAEVLNVYIDVEPVNFNRGFYSCDMTFFFLVNLEVFTSHNTCPVDVNGICFYNKKAILFGSEGSVKTFTSVMDDSSCETQTIGSTNMPKCVVQTVEPVALGAHLGKCKGRYEKSCYIPKNILEYLGSPLVMDDDDNTTVYASLGLFTIVQLVRNVQMLIPAYDFCMPEKHCCGDTTDQPCDVFRNLKFPTEDFFPPRSLDGDNPCGCGN
ncbi:MAG: hypothetical protein IJZ75_05715 [Clostridia bacterium]|nr:hypothetical protein [Clostridia bacterium]